MPSTRPTAELLLLVLAIAVAVEMVLTVVAITVISLARPDVDLSAASQAIGAQMSLTIGAVLGFVAGRSRPSEKGNPNGRTDPD